MFHTKFEGTFIIHLYSKVIWGGQTNGQTR